MEDSKQLLKQIYAYLALEGVGINLRSNSQDWKNYGVDDWCIYSFTWNNTHEIPKDISNHGINWEKTEPPIYETRSKFMDTDAPCEEVNVLMGCLTLDNGGKIIMGVVNPKPFALDWLERLNLIAKHQEDNREVYKSFFK